MRVTAVIKIELSAAAITLRNGCNPGESYALR